MARARAGLTLAEVGARTGLRPDVISRYERGKRLPDALRIQALADALGVNVAELAPGGPWPDDAITARIVRLLDGLPESRRAEALAAVARIRETYNGCSARESNRDAQGEADGQGT